MKELLLPAVVAVWLYRRNMFSINFSVAEFERSETADQMKIKNKITNPGIKDNLRRLVNAVLQPARTATGQAIIITSGYRSPALNAAIHGAVNSQHMLGEAADFVAANGDTASIFYWIKNNCDFDQLIWEEGNFQQPGWVHVSYRHNQNRNQVLRFNGVTYSNF